MTHSLEQAGSVIEFWFGDGDSNDDAAVAEAQSELWWSKSEAADAMIRQRFESTVEAAGRGELDHWAVSPRGSLALILLTDQFPRNIFRADPRSFGLDSKARRWCRSGLDAGHDRHLRPIERVFFYLPMEHSEAIEDQQRSVGLFRSLAEEADPEHRSLFRGYVDFAVRHRDIVVRFGRFPHRNSTLGRDSTPDEIAFLEQPGSSF